MRGCLKEPALTQLHGEGAHIQLSKQSGLATAAPLQTSNRHCFIASRKSLQWLLRCFCMEPTTIHRFLCRPQVARSSLPCTDGATVRPSAVYDAAKADARVFGWQPKSCFVPVTVTRFLNPRPCQEAASMASCLTHAALSPLSPYVHASWVKTRTLKPWHTK